MTRELVQGTDTDVFVIDRRHDDVHTTVATQAASSHTGTVVAIVGAALFVTGLGDALARTGHPAAALPLFFVGLVAIFVPCAWRLTSGTAARRSTGGVARDRHERMVISVILGVSLLASYYMRSPLIFDWFDELIHGATINNLLDNRTLLVHNSILPVSPYYPGLELVTIAVKWITGLPLVLAQLVVVVAQRVVLVLGVFLVVERVCGSARAAGIGVLVYASNPSFYTFASWDYGPLALSFAVATVYFLLSAIDHRARKASTLSASDGRSLFSEASARGLPRWRRDFCLAVASMAAMVVTHHLTAFLTAALLVMWAVGLRVSGRRDDARLIGMAAATNIVLVTGWTAFVGSHLFSYLGPLLSDASTGLGSIIGRLHSNRQLFHTSAGQGGASSWEIVVMLGAVVCFCLVLLPSVLIAVRKRTLGGGTLRFLPVVVAVGYPIAMVASLSSGSSQVGERTTTFVFFGMAIVVGSWLATRLSSKRGLLERGGMIFIAAVCFLGGMIYGSGPDVTYVPGPYLVGANQRSISAPSLALAQWASTNLPPGANVAVDRQNGALLADIAHVNMVTSISGLMSTGPLFFDKQFGPNDVSLIRKDHIRYVVIDLRLASSLPLFGTYIEPGEAKPGTRLTIAELSKFDSVPGSHRVYDNGPIQVYDVSSLLGSASASFTTRPNYGTGADGTNVTVLAASLVTALLLLFVRLRRRRYRSNITDRSVLRWIVGAMITGAIFACLTVPLHVSPTVIGLVGVALVLAIGLIVITRPTRGASSNVDDLSSPVDVEVGPRRGQRLYALAGLTLLVLGIVLATTTARQDWRPPDQLGIRHTPSGQALVTAQLASDTSGARLEVLGHHRVLLSRPLEAVTAPQSLVVPASIAARSAEYLLVTPGSVLAVGG